MIKGIERRISYVTHIPEVNGEGLQILHYEDGQKYEAHHDFFHDKFNSRPENGGQRIATVLMYLCVPCPSDRPCSDFEHSELLPCLFATHQLSCCPCCLLGDPWVRGHLSDAAEGFLGWYMLLRSFCRCVPAHALTTREWAGRAAAPVLLILPGFTCLGVIDASI